MAKLKYPIGIQDFRKIREEAYRYIDKTELIHALLTQGNYYFLSSPRRYLKSEVNSSLGCCDAIVQTATHIYAFEFKLEQSAAAAIQQIIDKNYLGPDQLGIRQKIALGINFSREKRSMPDFAWQELK